MGTQQDKEQESGKPEMLSGLASELPFFCLTSPIHVSKGAEPNMVAHTCNLGTQDTAGWGGKSESNTHSITRGKKKSISCGGGSWADRGTAICSVTEGKFSF